MATFPYMANPAKLKRFFQHIQDTGIPDKVTYEYLKSSGFTSSGDRAIVSILKALNFLDGSGVPQDNWRAFRDKGKAPLVLAKAIRETYSDLFSMYPDAQRKDKEALRNYFNTKTDVGKDAIRFILGTFSTLCEMGEFNGLPEDESSQQVDKTQTHAASQGQVTQKDPSGMTININIELALPATEDASVYEKLFAAMKTHLMS